MEKLLKTAEVAEMTGLASATLTTRRSKGGDAPPFIRMGARCVRYRLSDVLAWIEKQPTHRIAAAAREACC